MQRAGAQHTQSCSPRGYRWLKDFDGQNDSVFSDPSPLISKIPAAKQVPVSVSPETSINCAITIMLMRDFSQLPVMRGNDVKGVVSWGSIATRHFVDKNGPLGRHESMNVSRFMDSPQVISDDSTLFRAIPIIAEHSYVLVRARDKRVTGPVTASDLNDAFQTFAEPFYRLDEIEKRMREILRPRYTVQELASVRDPKDTDRNISSVEDLTFGDYVCLLQRPELWKKLNVEIDRKMFCNELDEVRKIRNTVMHFAPGKNGREKDVSLLRGFARFLRKLETTSSSANAPTGSRDDFHNAFVIE